MVLHTNAKFTPVLAQPEDLDESMVGLDTCVVKEAPPLVREAGQPWSLRLHLCAEKTRPSGESLRCMQWVVLASPCESLVRLPMAGDDALHLGASLKLTSLLRTAIVRSGLEQIEVSVAAALFD